MLRKNWKLTLVLAMVLLICSQTALAGVFSCTECGGLMNGPCLAEKYLPFGQFDPDPNSTREWSAVEGTFFAKDNMIGVRFQLDSQSMETLSQGGFGLEIEIVEKGGNKLNWKGRYKHNLPSNARVAQDSRAFDSGYDTVDAVLIRNPENLKAGTTYYVWFIFDSIPSSGVLIQPNLVIDIHTDCSLAKPKCDDVGDREVCEYFQMETDSYATFKAYPDGRDGVKWSSKKTSENYTPNLYKVSGLWFVTKETSNPPDSEDTQSGDDYNNLPSSVSGSSSGSSSKPDLYVKELRFKNGKTKYYDDEKIKIDGYVKNAGKSVDKKITKVALKLYRFKGEKENGDTKEIGSENMKGENLKSGSTKHEEFSFGAPDGDNKYQFYAIADAKKAVSESNENNNKSKAIACRVHKRPNIYVSDLTLDGGQTQFEQGKIPEARATFKNSGGESFWDVPVKWYLDGVHFASDNMRHWNIEHGDEKHESVNLINLSLGSHTLKVCADNSDDKDKSNNCREVTFSVIAPVIIPDPIVNPDPILNSSCEYFDVKKVFHAGLVDIWIIFKPELQSKVKVVGQTSPNAYWDNLSIYSGELCFQNWPTDASPEFSAYYYLDTFGNKQWLVAKLCPEFFNNNPDPSSQHFVIRPDTQNIVIDTNQYPAVENCQFFKLQKTSDIGGKVNYQIIFSSTIPNNLVFIGQVAPNDYWMEYQVSNRTVSVNNWPKNQPIEFAVYYFDTLGNKQWLVAKNCPQFFNNNPDPSQQHFVIYLD